MEDLTQRVTRLEEAYKTILDKISEIKNLINPKMEKVTSLETDMKWLKRSNKAIWEKIFFAGVLVISLINLVLTVTGK